MSFWFNINVLLSRSRLQKSSRIGGVENRSLDPLFSPRRQSYISYRAYIPTWHRPSYIIHHGHTGRTCVHTLYIYVIMYVGLRSTWEGYHRARGARKAEVDMFPKATNDLDFLFLLECRRCIYPSIRQGSDTEGIRSLGATRAVLFLPPASLLPASLALSTSPASPMRLRCLIAHPCRRPSHLHRQSALPMPREQKKKG